jgi:hypothetical protein
MFERARAGEGGKRGKDEEQEDDLSSHANKYRPIAFSR